MSYRMPFPATLLPIALVAAALGGFASWIMRATSADVARTHTIFALKQVSSFLNEQSPSGLPTDQEKLMALLQTSGVDRNSCRLSQKGITDSWGEPIRTTFDRKSMTWTFRSSGEDRKHGTLDDIKAKTSLPQAHAMPEALKNHFGEAMQEIWAVLSKDGKVTADEMFEACYRQGRSHHDGDGQLDAAYALLCLSDDPIPMLRKKFQDPKPERRAYAVKTAGILGDIRLKDDLRKMTSDEAKLGQFPGDWFWDTVGDAAESALRELNEGGFGKYFKEQHMPIPNWFES